MGHCNEVNVILPNTIDNIVGKARNNPLAEFPSKGSTRFWVSSNAFDCLFDGQ